jgi:uracil-DNA glycosylase
MKSWNEIFRNKIDEQTRNDLKQKTDQLYEKETVYPPQEELFEAFKRTPLHKVKAVILGQDPYPNARQAHGLAFSSRIDIPASLKNIYKELELEYGTCPETGDLTSWADQGVLLLNTILTTKAGKPLSCKDMGWQTLTNAAIDALNEEDRPIVFFLWGKEAQKAEKRLTNQNHLIIKSPHPSPLSAYRGFFGSGQFKKANAFLEKNHIEPIDWVMNGE